MICPYSAQRLYSVANARANDAALHCGLVMAEPMIGAKAPACMTAFTSSPVQMRPSAKTGTESAAASRFTSAMSGPSVCGEYGV